MTSLTVFAGLDYHQAFVMNVGGTMLINRPYDNSAAVRPCGSVQLELAQDVGWDQWRFAAPAHRQFSKFFFMVGRRSKRAGPTLRMPQFEIGRCCTHSATAEACLKLANL